jgi:CopA family copper-resistance protein
MGAYSGLTMPNTIHTELPGIDRRQFLKVSAALTVISGISAERRELWAAVEPAGASPLEVAEYDLAVGRLGVSFSGDSAEARAINGMIPGPLLRLKEGQDVILRVTNNLDETTSLHWHGLLVPFEMDGVPGFSFDGIEPGQTFTYRFRARQAGTYWYHSHSGGQEQRGVYAPIVIEPAGDDPVAFDREHVLVLSDWTDEAPMEVLRNLKGNGGYYNYGKRTLPGFVRDLFDDAGAAIRDRDMWGRMRMDPTDIADVSGATYTFLLNGRTAQQNWTGLFRAGERVRLRIVNAAAMTYFDLKIPGLNMTVVQADGQDVEPVSVEELQIAVAETYDVVVEPEAGQTYTIFAQTLDRSGFVRGTLAERDGAEALVPPTSPRPLRSMRMDGMEGMEGHEMAGLGMDMPAVAADPADPPAAAHAGHAMAPASDMVHAKLEYSHLRALTPNPDIRDPQKEVVFRLTGDMERYFWTLNDKKLGDSDPIHLQVDERVRVRFVNETMMEHPMHLHGVYMELQNGQDRAHAPRKHTISVKSFETVEVHITFEEAGPWALHCHLLYHMATGMFARVEVAEASVAQTS